MITFKDLALYLKETNWELPPLPDRFLHAYLNEDLDSEEMKIMKRKTSRDKNLAKRLKLDFAYVCEFNLDKGGVKNNPFLQRIYNLNSTFQKNLG